MLATAAAQKVPVALHHGGEPHIQTEQGAPMGQIWATLRLVRGAVLIAWGKKLETLGKTKWQG